jgi:pantetheine-phosphate adenylyltransferase
MNKKNAVYPGSFDPMTKGHLDIIHRVSQIFNKVIVLVSETPHKTSLFNSDERKNLVRGLVTRYKNVEVDSHEGLTTAYMKKNDFGVVIRGMRSSEDFSSEFTMANMNFDLEPGVETMVIFSRPELSSVSSRLVKEIANYGGDLSKFVPDSVNIAILNKYKK